MTRQATLGKHARQRSFVGAGNRSLEIIPKMFNLAEMWGLRQDGTHPRKHTKKYPKRERSERPFSFAAYGC